MPPQPRVLVTGAAGQLGRALVRERIAAGCTVHALVRTPAQAIALRAEGAEIYAGALADTGLVATAARGVDVVYHLAGGVRGAGHATPDVLNREGTEALLRALEGARGAGPVVVLASSAAVYGDRSGLWVDETYPTSPQSRYGESKVAAEALLLASGHRARVARIGMVLGVGPEGPLRVVQLARRRAWLPGDGVNHVPVVHLDDALGGLRAIAEQGEDGAVVHLAAPTTPTLRETMDALARAQGSPPPRFVGTWVPSALQRRGTAAVEAGFARVGLRPPVTPDTLALWTASVRLRTERLAALGCAWRAEDPVAAVAGALARGA
jgi:UDP-glucose 4-epimerase